MRSIIHLYSASLLLFVLASGVAALAVSQGKDVPPDSAAARFFETKIRPILADNCFSCHGDQEQKAGLRLDRKADALKGAASGAVLIPGGPEKSPLIRAIGYMGVVRMPPSGKLKPEEVALLTEWVRNGALWPDAKAVPVSPVPGAKFQLSPAQRNFWSFRPVRRPAIPVVKNRAWVKSPIDAFILARLEKQGISPTPIAHKRTLIRRATFDLTGLPPTPEEVDTFLKDSAPNAFARVVDRLLASPRYGERWARHWLDVVRYCDSLDSRGSGSEGDLSEVWRYRDWVINALNRDMPYTDFIKYQVAGDLLPGPNGSSFNRDGVIATGMLAVGNWGNGDADKDKILTDIADDQVDVVSRGFMGLTVACARCHNHKFDPISTQDYYGLAGIFFSTHILPKLTPKGQGEVMLRIPLASPEEMAERKQHAEKVTALENSLKSTAFVESREFALALLPETPRYMTAAWEYANRPAERAALTLSEFAREKKLYEFALRQWMDYLGLGDYRLMATPVKDVLGAPGVYAWKGPGDTPSLTVNTNADAKTLLTFTLLPKSVAIHPGPTTGVAVSWKSPISGTVSVSGRVSDADPAGGDGIAWSLVHKRHAGASELASGMFENGGSQTFANGTGAEKLAGVAVKAGESIQLRVLPRASHTCDTTTVEIAVAEAGGRTWSLSADLLADPVAANPHPDRSGTPGVWHFQDMASSRPGPAPPPEVTAALGKWEKAVSQAADAHVVEAASKEFARAAPLSDDPAPFMIAYPAEGTLLPQAAKDKLAAMAQQLDTLRKQTPPPLQYANGAQDGGVPESPQAGTHDVRVHIRGNYARLGEVVPRRFPEVLTSGSLPVIKKGSGRLELAQWLASDTHPTVARVMVNRVWQHHFGEGIVRTPSNFGFLGERPTHHELLDYLASEFMKNGWSLKKLHRAIMLSSTYQQASIAPAATVRADPDNRLFSRMNRRRLEAEAVRDNLLAVCGKLDTTMGGPAVRDFSMPRRTVYVITIRSDRAGFGPLFDMADSTAPVDKRTVSTVAPQALFLMNNAFAVDRAKELADRLLKEAPGDEAARIQRAYQLLFGRPPVAAEVKVGRDFLDRSRRVPAGRVAGPGAPDIDLAAWREYCAVLLCANEFIYVD
jgi:hypothetical protein